MAGGPFSPTAIFLLMTTRHGLIVKRTVQAWGLTWPLSVQKLSRYAGRLTSFSLVILISLPRKRNLSALLCLYAFASFVWKTFSSLSFSSYDQFLWTFLDLIHILFPPENYPHHLPYFTFCSLSWRYFCGTLHTV